ncbi:MAG TPA: fimbrial assembly protein, partial [Opitutus sp.]|nr:fimbrial assembly protein [Opitutus sp.]
MLQRHTRVPGLIVADLGAAHVAAGRFTRSLSGELRLDALEFTATNPDPDKDNASRATYAAWFEQSTLTGTPRSHLHVALPAHLVLTKRLATPRVPRSKRVRVFAFEAAQNTPYPLDEVVWDYGAVTEHGAELEAILAVAKRDALAPLGVASHCGRI